jgi:predicted flap endonuclease-1-like 5' DNA nuclease
MIVRAKRRRHVASGYYIDLEGFSLERFRHILETGEVLPGRKVLKEKTAERFAALEAMGITNMKELIDALKTKKRLERSAQESGLPVDYLTVLRREANSYLPNPVNLRDIPDVNPEYVKRLDALGIKHSKHLFERTVTLADRAELSKLSGVPDDALLELVKMSNLARIYGVGPVYARLLYDTGADTLDKIDKCSPEDLLQRLHEVNDEKKYTKPMPILKDVEDTIEFARDLRKVTEYE